VCGKKLCKTVKMKELILSAVEKDFILKAIGERKRLDGRQAYDVRQMNIQFGVDSGCCVVDLGQTKVTVMDILSHADLSTAVSL